jgi:ABC-2 type transport system ATP-binding protein
VAIEVSGLTKRFGDVVALDGLDLSVGTGEVHGLLGPNGAGKSTLLRILFGLVRPDQGTVTIFGRQHQRDGSVETLADVAGFVDRPHFYPYLTARRTLELLAEADGDPDPPIDEALDATGLTGAARRKVGGWSTGMVQRLGIACALVRRPRLLLLDEPTEGLDPKGARELLDLVQSLTTAGLTVLMSSHDMAEVDAICDHATIVRRGTVACRGSLDELREAAPPGRRRLVTSDDDGAVLVAEQHAIQVERLARGGLTLGAGPAELHDYICDLGRRGISVVQLEQELPPLTALFFELTNPADEAVPA